VFDAYILIFQFLRFVFGGYKHLVQTSGYVNLIDWTRRPGDLWHLIDLALDGPFQGLDVHTRAREDRGHKPALLIQQRLQKVFNFDLLIAVSGR
jgi:hypothetical protein